MEGRGPAHPSEAPGSSFGPPQGRADVQKGVAVEKGVVKAGGRGACGLELETKGQKPFFVVFRMLKVERNLS